MPEEEEELQCGKCKAKLEDNNVYFLYNEPFCFDCWLGFDVHERLCSLLLANNSYLYSLLNLKLHELGAYEEAEEESRKRKKK